MDLNNVSRILKKINRLYELVQDIGEASKTEKDLLKAYILDLYDAVLHSDSKEDVDLEIEEMKKKIKKQKKLEKKIKKKIQAEQEPEVKKEVKDVESSKATVTKDKDENFDKVAYKEESIKIEEKTVPLVDSAITDLFVLENSNEISDRLGQVLSQTSLKR